jgi:hypothetical protein
LPVSLLRLFLSICHFLELSAFTCFDRGGRVRSCRSVVVGMAEGNIRPAKAFVRYVCNWMKNAKLTLRKIVRYVYCVCVLSIVVFTARCITTEVIRLLTTYSLQRECVYRAVS